jgi:hypothetical protein
MLILVVLFFASDCSNLVLQNCNVLKSGVGLGLPHEEEGQYRRATGNQHSYVLLR